MWMAVKECGWPAFVAIFFGLIGLAVGVVALVLAVASKGRGGALAGMGAVVLAVVCAGVGAFGVWRGRAVVGAILGSEAIDPEMKERIREEGYKEAAQCMNVGLVDAAAPLVLGLIAVGVTFARRREGGGAGHLPS
jgi:hypothetical protein